MNFRDFYSFYENFFRKQSQKDHNEIGKALFKYNFDENVVSQKVAKIIYDDLLYIGKRILHKSENGNFEDLKFKYLFKCMVTSYALELHLGTFFSYSFS